ncbi:MAG: ComEC/Rec2 family competence protein [Gemmobacter sp.]
MRAGRLALGPVEALVAARGTLFPFVPVLIACGIAVWLGLPSEPGKAAYMAAAAVGLSGAIAWRRAPVWADAAAVALLCLALGFLAAGARAHRVAGPVLEFRYFGPVEGRIVVIDRSQSDALRLTLDRVVLDRVAPHRVPRRVRIALHGGAGDHLVPEPGMRVMTTAHLAAPDGPVEPGGFDFQRMAWFRSLGAVGYTRTPVLVAALPEAAEQRINRLRNRIATAVRAAVPGDPGAFAAAILTGDRSGIGQTTLQALRDSNLAHLLAISGLHMGLLTAFVFAGVRSGLALVPPVALRLATKKVAAVVALGAAGFYLALSGGNVATERAFVMVAVMLVAVLADRRALSLRSVAIAATLILLVQPETLVEPGFQMSFAATAALVAGFSALRGRASLLRLPGWFRPFAVLVLSSGLAGLATAPVAAAHFNRIAEYGLLANLLTVPLMGLAVIPAAVVAGILAPLGLAAPALWVMEQATRWILGVAHWVAGLSGAVVAVPVPAAWVLPALAAGMVWVILWRGRARWAGIVPVLAALWFWQGAGRPVLLIASDAGLVGLMGPGGRALSAPRGNGFAARVWLESDGDRADQATAAARPGFEGPRGQRRFSLDGIPGTHLTGRGAADKVDGACAEARLVIVAAEVARTPAGCIVIDRRLLARTGAVAVAADAQGGIVLTPSRRATRLWSGRPGAGDEAGDEADRVRPADADTGS